MRSFVVLLLVAGAGPALALPDLTPEIYAVEIDTHQTVGSGDVAEGCAGATSGRTLLRFGVRAHNVADQPEVIGDPGCPDCALYPGAACANPEFECSPADGHKHPHFESFARYELLDMRGNDVALGAKRGFCIRDDGPAPGCDTFDCTNQGISVGCCDDYGPQLGCQYIDVTDVAGIETRAFRLRVTIDPLTLLVDSDRSNNVGEVVLPGCGDGRLDPGEQCDPGIPVVGTCCDADCHLIAGCDTSCALRPAGTVCRPATGPCDVAEACDGTSPACPPDVGLPDGASCGAGTPPCIVDTCVAGACVARQLDDACLVGASCYAPGASDPTDACLVCDPVRNVDLWSANRAATPAGVFCELERVAMATSAIGCPRALNVRIARRLTRARTIATQLASASPAAVRRGERRLLALGKRLAILLQRGEHRGCQAGTALSELQSLVAQLETMSGLSAKDRAR